MTEREKLYSCLLHHEVEENGRELKNIASCLGLSHKKGYRLMKAYKQSYEDYKVLTLNEIAKIKRQAHRLLVESRAKANRIVEQRKATSVIDYAFNMPITAKEKREYFAIAALVARDEYLPVGYRKPKDDNPRIINNPNKYQY